MTSLTRVTLYPPRMEEERKHSQDSFLPAPDKEGRVVAACETDRIVQGEGGEYWGEICGSNMQDEEKKQRIQEHSRARNRAMNVAAFVCPRNLCGHCGACNKRGIPESSTLCSVLPAESDKLFSGADLVETKSV